MRFVSTRGRAPAVDFRTALFQGLAPDGGLYVPEQLNLRSGDGLDDLGIARAFVGDEIPRSSLSTLLDEALNFSIPLRQLDDRLSVLELFHGPTFAFKDVGARVMARLMGYFNSRGDPLTVLVATSGDTGSAVAQAFFGVAGTRVVVLFPDGQVSRVQEAQFATLGGNVTAVAVAGTFDDCQRMVKGAFSDTHLRARARLTSANSINVGRLMPQVFYYARAAALSPGSVFSVPCGNFGNLTAGLFAMRLGAAIRGFVAATTINDTVPRYLATGDYRARPSVATLANAMDVGDPSNVERMRWFFNDQLDAMRGTIACSVHTDRDVRSAIAGLWRSHEYLADPHTAIGYLGTKGVAPPAPAVFLATAHAAKFREVIEPVIGAPVPLPPALAEALRRPRQVQKVEPRLAALKPLLERIT